MVPSEVLHGSFSAMLGDTDKMNVYYMSDYCVGSFAPPKKLSTAAIQLSFERSDPLYVATGLYYLKYPSVSMSGAEEEIRDALSLI